MPTCLVPAGLPKEQLPCLVCHPPARRVPPGLCQPAALLGFFSLRRLQKEISSKKPAGGSGAASARAAGGSARVPWLPSPRSLALCPPQPPQHLVSGPCGATSITSPTGAARNGCFKEGGVLAVPDLQLCSCRLPAPSAPRPGHSSLPTALIHTRQEQGNPREPERAAQQLSQLLAPLISPDSQTGTDGESFILSASIPLPRRLPPNPQMPEHRGRLAARGFKNASAWWEPHCRFLPESTLLLSGETKTETNHGRKAPSPANLLPVSTHVLAPAAPAAPWGCSHPRDGSVLAVPSLGGEAQGDKGIAAGRGWGLTKHRWPPAAGHRGCSGSASPPRGHVGEAKESGAERLRGTSPRVSAFRVWSCQAGGGKYWRAGGCRTVLGASQAGRAAGRAQIPG